MSTITGFSVPTVYPEVLWHMKTNGVEQNSRNGKVLTLLDPLTVKILCPQQRVLTDPTRNANPFFHALEFVWMMAGRRDAAFIGELVKQLYQYAEDNGNFHGAYGFRWQKHFSSDQIPYVISMLKNDPETRRAVIAMWDPDHDLMRGSYKDHPCNTHLYFRVVDGALNMTVCNRSNDVVWGMLGANAVHMTLLQEVIATFAGYDVGPYYVMTNNAHIYKDLPNYDDIMKFPVADDIYGSRGAHHIDVLPMIDDMEDYFDFQRACAVFCDNPLRITGSFWLDNVANPMYLAYMEKQDSKKALGYAATIAAPDWRIAAEEWIKRNRGDK